MLLSDIYYLKKHEAVEIRLLPNIDSIGNPFFVKTGVNYKGQKTPYHYVYSIIDNKYRVFYTGTKIHNFILKKMIEGVNPFDLKNGLALRIRYTKLDRILRFGDLSMSHTQDLDFIYDKKYVIWNGLDEDKERVLKFMKNKRYTMSDLVDKKKAINDPIAFFEF